MTRVLDTRRRHTSSVTRDLDVGAVDVPLVQVGAVHSREDPDVLDAQQVLSSRHSLGDAEPHLRRAVALPVRVVGRTDPIDLEPVGVDAAEALEVVVGGAREPDEAGPAVPDALVGLVVAAAGQVDADANFGAGRDHGRLGRWGRFEGEAAAGEVGVGRDESCVAQLRGDLGVLRVERRASVVLGVDVTDILPVLADDAVNDQAREGI